ncbi:MULTISPECIES: hypothetical protein [Polyangium]|uniref:Uncharacterized protein n=1 Tax=Polyangium sorediatum TaxID=889274 RepID=A0ABT6NKU3_9BACT|nr:hypothetical protein [Polyangium sorediatum]MDI1428893.1 hypothetical protein [Polyangium sorediatum]
MIAFVEKVPSVVWLTPIVQNVMSRSVRAMISADARSSSSVIPQIAATRAGSYSRSIGKSSSQPSVCAATNASSMTPISRQR